MKSIAPPITSLPTHGWFSLWIGSILIELKIQHATKQGYYISTKRLQEWQNFKDELTGCRRDHSHIITSVDILIDELQKRNDGAPATERRAIDINDVSNLSREVRLLDHLCTRDIGIKY